MKLYVACIRLSKGGGPHIKANRIDVPIDVPDRGQASYKHAQEAGPILYAEQTGCPAEQVYVFGVYG